MQQSTPNFYAVIPSTVRYCKDLPPAARLLYGEITALVSKEGFCWATNGYFQNLYSVSERTIRYWLESLRKKGFIKIEIIRDGFQVSRKIWITEGIKKAISTGKKLPEVRKKVAGGQEKSCRYINTESSTYNKDDDIPNSCCSQLEVDEKPSPPLSEKEKLKKDIGKTLNIEQFERGYECYLGAKEKQSIRNPAAWIITAAFKKFKTAKDESKKNKDTAKKIEDHFTRNKQKGVDIYALNRYLEIVFVGCNMASKCVNYEGRTFDSWWEEVKSILGRYKLPDFG